MQLFVLLYVIFITVLFDILFPCRLQLHFSIALLYFLPSLSFLCYYNLSYSIFIFILSLSYSTALFNLLPLPLFFIYFPLLDFTQRLPPIPYSFTLPPIPFHSLYSPFPLSCTCPSYPFLSFPFQYLSSYLHLSLLSYPILSPLLLHFPTPP